MAVFQARKRGLKAAGGFTLVELLVVISILGVLAAVVVLNVVGFITSGRVEAKAVELKQVHTAAGCYIVEGNSIVSTETVGPGDMGILTAYLAGGLQYYWSIDPDGSVHEIFFAGASDSLDGFTSLAGSWTSSGDTLSAGGTAGTLLATGGDWDDFTFQTTAAFTSDDSYGLYYRSNSDASDGYVLQFDPVSDSFVVRKIVDGVESAPIATMPMGAGFSGTHGISVSVSGSSHTISVGGTSMTFTDGTFGSGTVGLQSSDGSDVNFTGFTVSPP